MSLIRMGRGQPLIALVAVLGGWIGGRAATWAPPAFVTEAEAVQTPAPLGESEAPIAYRVDPASVPSSRTTGVQMQGAQSPAGYGYGSAGAATPGFGWDGYRQAAYDPASYEPSGYRTGHGVPPGYALLPLSALVRLAQGQQRIVLVAGPVVPGEAGEAAPGLATAAPLPRARGKSKSGIGWNLLTQLFRLPGGSRAGGGRDEFPANEEAPGLYAPELSPAAPGAVPASSPAAPASPRTQRRWSADAWALLRRDTADARLSPGAVPASYGASQAGAVLRYRLSLKDPHQPAFYLRTTSSMGQIRQSSAAAGLSARPFGDIPVVAAIEARLTEQAGGRQVQPVAMAVTELAPFPLPGRFRGEAYLQGGYVAGKYATPFADGQLRVDRSLWSNGAIEARLGAGIWGGGQKGAARLDAGPSASLALPLGRGLYGRAAIDWRLRMAGDAVPGSGPALTLSAGF